MIAVACCCTYTYMHTHIDIPPHNHFTTITNNTESLLHVASGEPLSAMPTLCSVFRCFRALDIWEQGPLQGIWGILVCGGGCCNGDDDDGG